MSAEDFDHQMEILKGDKRFLLDNSPKDYTPQQIYAALVVVLGN
jgi:hypothetical protein